MIDSGGEWTLDITFCSRCVIHSTIDLHLTLNLIQYYYYIECGTYTDLLWSNKWWRYIFCYKLRIYCQIKLLSLYINSCNRLSDIFQSYCGCNLVNTVVVQQYRRAALKRLANVHYAIQMLIIIRSICLKQFVNSLYRRVWSFHI